MRSGRTMYLAFQVSLIDLRQLADHPGSDDLAVDETC